MLNADINDKSCYISENRYFVGVLECEVNWEVVVYVVKGLQFEISTQPKMLAQQGQKISVCDTKRQISFVKARTF